MNQLLEIVALNNKYFALRHGESTANVEGIIVSTPENGIDKYGLSENGRSQVEKTIEKAKSDKLLDSKTRIISSDFKRAFESAAIAGQILDTEYLIEPEPRLRERDFGSFELLSNEHYQTVWDKDALDGSHTSNNVESAEVVMQRVSAFVWSLESYYKDQTFLLVAHGDTLQILQAAFQKFPAANQRDMPHLETAELRPLIMKQFLS
jgi:probable phosphoglycerate mutase